MWASIIVVIVLVVSAAFVGLCAIIASSDNEKYGYGYDDKEENNITMRNVDDINGSE